MTSGLAGLLHCSLVSLFRFVSPKLAPGQDGGIIQTTRRAFVECL